MIKPISGDDILVWPDDTWCFRQFLDEYAHMSDDFRVIPVDTPEWDAFINDDTV